MATTVCTLIRPATSFRLAYKLVDQYGFSGDGDDIEQEAQLFKLLHPDWTIGRIVGAIKKQAKQKAGKSIICRDSLDADEDEDKPTPQVEDKRSEMRHSQRGGEEDVLGGLSHESCTSHLKDQIVVKRGMTDRRYRQILQANKERILDKKQPDLFGLGGGVSSDE